MQPLAGILSLLVAIAGWFYLFYSKGATNLSGVEDAPLNTRRVHLRRLGGLIMLALAVLLYAGVYAVDGESDPAAFVTIWLTVMALLAAMVTLALIDLRLTRRIKKMRDARGTT